MKLFLYSFKIVLQKPLGVFRSIENGVENILYEPALDKASEGKRSNENQQTAIPKAVFFFEKQL